MTDPYDMIEQLAAMQIAPADWAEWHASQGTIKAAIQVIGEQIDTVERLRATNAELLAAVEALLKVFWYDFDADVMERGEAATRAEQAVARAKSEATK